MLSRFVSCFPIPKINYQLATFIQTVSYELPVFPLREIGYLIGLFSIISNNPKQRLKLIIDPMVKKQREGEKGETVFNNCQLSNSKWLPGIDQVTNQTMFLVLILLFAKLI